MPTTALETQKRKREYAAKWEAQNREKRSLQRRELRKKNPAHERETVRKWRRKNPERAAEIARKSYQKHSVARKKWQRKYFQENREEIRRKDWIRYRDSRKKRLAQSRARRLWLYGLTAESYQQMLSQQKRRCAICKRRFSKIHRACVDHCHKTDNVRALLCVSCNGGLGLFEDRPRFLKAAISYLRRFQ